MCMYVCVSGFFVATQFFFTLCFTLLLIATFLVALYMCCSREHERFVMLLLVIGSDLVIAGNVYQIQSFYSKIIDIKKGFLVDYRHK